MLPPTRFKGAKPLGRLLYILETRATDGEFHPRFDDTEIHRERVAEWFAFYYDLNVRNACGLN